MTKGIKILMICAAAAVLTVSAVFAAWWFGAFLPRDIITHEYDTAYGEGRVTLRRGRLSYTAEDISWRPDPGTIVQDMIIRDVDRDGEEELVTLVWKHGSFGDHIPFWVEHNDIRLEQHVFIFRAYPGGMRRVWMSSSIGKDVISMSGWGKDKLLLHMRSGEDTVWIWQDFGLRLAGECPGGRVSVICAGDNLVHPVLLYDNKNKSRRTI